ncbi:MAG: c-type cytochrome [Caldilineaceae bacterium]
MKRFTFILATILVLALFLAACGGSDEEPTATPVPATATPKPVGDAIHGEQLYKQPTLGSANAPSCSTCHSLEPGVKIVGPSHATIGKEAATRVPGMSAEEYLRQSIKEPNANVSEGYVAGVMYQNYAKDLSEQDINDLVAFLLTRQ